MSHNRQEKDSSGFGASVTHVGVLFRLVLFSLSRITAAVEKVELLWQQAFSQARFQLQKFQLWEEVLQVSRRTSV